MLFEKVWGYHFDAQSGVIEVQCLASAAEARQRLYRAIVASQSAGRAIAWLCYGGQTHLKKKQGMHKAQKIPPRQQEAESSRDNKPRPEDSSAAR